MKTTARIGRNVIRDLAGKYLISASEWANDTTERGWYLRGRASALREALERVTGLGDRTWEDLARDYTPDVEDTVQAAGRWALARLESRTGTTLPAPDRGIGGTAARDPAKRFPGDVVAKSLAPMMTCQEVTDLIEVLRENGEDDAADTWVSYHRLSDDECDLSDTPSRLSQTGR